MNMQSGATAWTSSRLLAGIHHFSAALYFQLSIVDSQMQTHGWDNSPGRDLLLCSPVFPPPPACPPSPTGQLPAISASTTTTSLLFQHQNFSEFWLQKSLHHATSLPETCYPLHTPLTVSSERVLAAGSPSTIKKPQAPCPPLNLASLSIFNLTMTCYLQQCFLLSSNLHSPLLLPAITF